MIKLIIFFLLIFSVSFADIALEKEKNNEDIYLLLIEVKKMNTKLDNIQNQLQKLGDYLGTWKLDLGPYSTRPSSNSLKQDFIHPMSVGS